MKKRIEILETTLRDGAYMIDFQFTAEDTTLIASALDGAGFRWIEIGHGLGLNACPWPWSEFRWVGGGEQFLESVHP